LSKIASLELKQNAGVTEPICVDLRDVLTDLRIVLEPCCEESGIELEWNISDNLRQVQVDRHSLLQVLLNLTKNSQRALETAPRKVISIEAYPRKDGVSVRVSDTGPGIPAPHKLFQPLQKDADETGLGLYLSRAFMRAYRGDLRHDASQPGCSFVIELACAVENVDEGRVVDQNAAHTTVAS
jgi:two-component system, LuxR family, sensor kinase FixL